MIVTHSIVKNMVDSVAQDGLGELSADAKNRLGEMLTQKLQHPMYSKQVRENAADARKRGDSSYFLNPDLEVISRETNPVQYQPLFWRQIIDTEPLTPGGTSFTYRMLDKSGKAEIRDTLAGDAPDIDVFNTETTTNCKFLRAKYHYTIADLRSAALAQKPLVQDKRQAAMDAIELGLNDIAMAGNPVPAVTTGLFGWRTLKENFALAAMLEALSTGTWSAATSAEIMRDLAEIFAAIAVNTKNNWGLSSANRGSLNVAMSHVHYNRCSTLLNGVAGTLGSVLSAIESLYGLKVWSLPELHDGAANGTDERIIVWHKDPRVISSNEQFQYVVTALAATPNSQTTVALANFCEMTIWMFGNCIDRIPG